MKDLTDHRVIVTGGGQGLGREICLNLAGAGCHVFVADINDKTAREVVDDITHQGGSASALQLDIGDEKSIKSAMEEVRRDGSLDILINNAGVDVTKPIEELSIEEIDRVIRINLRGTFLMSKMALEDMYQQKKGQIVNIASTAAKRAWANASAYHATKWGVVGLSRGLYVEAREHGVKVSTVIPGGMRTPFILDRFPDTPLNKLQDPKNVADVVRFILMQPDDSIIPEVMSLPLMESSWP